MNSEWKVKGKLGHPVQIYFKFAVSRALKRDCNWKARNSRSNPPAVQFVLQDLTKP